MALTQEQQNKLVAVIDSKATRKTCPGCGESRWQLGPEMVILQAFSPGSPMQLGVGYPCIALQCRICGNTQLYNVYILGVGDIVGVAPSGAK